MIQCLHKRTYVLRTAVTDMVIQEEMGIKEKLEILADAAKYDVACTSSGVE